MPKKLCALTLTPDGKTIVAGDKFGDVYALPLHPSQDYVPPRRETQVAPEEFKPSASELTVHTKGNLDALKQQRAQKNVQPKKESPNFEHKLLLGHVSMLTDVLVAEADVNGRTRQYILTSDRDEHIRVSRGLSQPHIIEAYCLGHLNFVNNLRILPWERNIMITGGGDLCLKSYKWRTGEMLVENDFSNELKEEIQNHLNEHNPDNRTLDKLAISNIWPVSFPDVDTDTFIIGSPYIVLVALEGRVHCTNCGTEC